MFLAISEIYVVDLKTLRGLGSLLGLYTNLLSTLGITKEAISNNATLLRHIHYSGNRLIDDTTMNTYRIRLPMIVHHCRDQCRYMLYY